MPAELLYLVGFSWICLIVVSEVRVFEKYYYHRSPFYIVLFCLGLAVLCWGTVLVSAISPPLRSQSFFITEAVTIVLGAVNLLAACAIVFFEIFFRWGDPPAMNIKAG